MRGVAELLHPSDSKGWHSLAYFSFPASIKLAKSSLENVLKILHFDFMLWCFHILLTALILSPHPKPAEIPSKQTLPMDSSSLLPSLLCLLRFRIRSETSWCQLTCISLQTPSKGPKFSLPTHLVKHPSGRGSAWHTVNSSLVL